MVTPHNFEVSVSAESRESFSTAMRMIFSAAPGKKVAAYRVAAMPIEGRPPLPVLILYWHFDAPVSVLLPYGMQLEEAVAFAWGWLQSAPYPKDNGPDGGSAKGFKVETVCSKAAPFDSFYAFAAIYPKWMYYPK